MLEMWKELPIHIDESFVIVNRKYESDSDDDEVLHLEYL
jgi:hypothetical protein